MKSVNEYKAPKAEITVFECAEDIMTASGEPTKSLKTKIDGSTDYVKLDSKSWSQIYGN